MRNTTASEPLLERVRREIGCPWLSDLRLRTEPARLLEILRRIPAGDYSYREWMDALEYLAGDAPPLPEEPRLRLLLRLERAAGISKK